MWQERLIFGRSIIRVEKVISMEETIISFIVRIEELIISFVINMEEIIIRKKIISDFFLLQSYLRLKGRDHHRSIDEN